MFASCKAREEAINQNRIAYFTGKTQTIRQSSASKKTSTSELTPGQNISSKSLDNFAATNSTLEQTRIQHTKRLSQVKLSNNQSSLSSQSGNSIKKHTDSEQSLSGRNSIDFQKEMPKESPDTNSTERNEQKNSLHI